MQHKMISYSHPTSSNACRFKMSMMGCYTVSLVEIDPPHYGIPKALTAFQALEEARAYADTLAHPWGRYTL